MCSQFLAGLDDDDVDTLCSQDAGNAFGFTQFSGPV
jgi:hypothetical protein